MELLTVLKKRHSTRKFTKEVVPKEQVKEILHYAKEYTPSSIGAWQASFVIVQDKEKLKKIVELTGGQQHIADAGTFVVVIIDFNRTNEACIINGYDQHVHESTEGLIVGTMDVGLYTMSAQMVIENLGLGSTIVGGIRNNTDAIIEMLELPEKTFPIVGFTIGYKTDAKVIHKPRMSDESVIFEEVYNVQKVKAEIPAYDSVFSQYLKLSNLDGNYSKRVSEYYKKPYSRDIKPVLNKQGFKLS